MQIKLKSIKIRDLIDGYINDPDKGVWGYGGKLDSSPYSKRLGTEGVVKAQRVISHKQVI